MLRRFLNGIITGTGFLVAVALIPGASALSLSYYTGAGGSNPISEPSMLGDLNNLIHTLNTSINMNFAATANSSAGEPQFTSATAWAQNATVATGLTSVGPVGSHTTVQQWLTVVNNSGTLRYIPAF